MRVIATLGLLAAAWGATANPIRRVVTLLEKMKTELQAEADKEADLYQKFECFCKSNGEKLDTESAAAKQKIGDLKAAIQQHTAEKQRVDAEVSEHKQDRAEAQAAVKSANTVREREHAAYVEESGASKGNIDALNEAIPLLERGMGVALLQSSGMLTRVRAAMQVATGLDSLDREAIQSFLQAKGEYQPASGQIVGILKQMKDQMDHDLNGIVADEEAAQQAFDALVAAKKKEIVAAGAAIEVKTERSGNLAVAAATAKGDLKDTENSLGAAQRYAVELAQGCEQREKENGTRSTDRAQELTSVSEAIQILNNDDALEAFTAAKSHSQNSFLQNSSARATARGLARARALLQSSSSRSVAVSTLQFLLKGKDVSFAKINKMIDDMVSHLDKEQTDDDSHRDWCRSEFNANDGSRKSLRAKAQATELALSEASDAASALAAEIDTLHGGVASLDKAVAEAGEQRKAENAAFVEEQTDLRAAVELLGKAENRLQKYYNPALYKAPEKRARTEEERIEANLSSFFQVSAPREAAPETWESAERKNLSHKNSGVLALMGMLRKELETSAQEGQHQEEAAQKQYEKLAADSKAEREADVQSARDKAAAKADLEGRIADAKDSAASTADELAGAQDYKQQLHKSCDFLVQTYDVRKAARAMERESLRNARAALAGAK